MSWVIPGRRKRRFIRNTQPFNSEGQLFRSDGSQLVSFSPGENMCHIVPPWFQVPLRVRVCGCPPPYLAVEYTHTSTRCCRFLGNQRTFLEVVNPQLTLIITRQFEGVVPTRRCLAKSNKGSRSHSQNSFLFLFCCTIVSYRKWWCSFERVWSETRNRKREQPEDWLEMTWRCINCVLMGVLIDAVKETIADVSGVSPSSFALTKG